MEHEFPELEYQNYQNEFLEDWWTRKKLFKGFRQSGKTTLIISELNRFLDRGMDCLVIVPRRMNQKLLFEEYEKRFGERPNCEVRTMDGIEHARGSKFDAVLIDEAQHMPFEDIWRDVAVFDSMFVRACACMTSMGDEWEDKADEWFESVYIS